MRTGMSPAGPGIARSTVWATGADRKSTRLNSSHSQTSYAVSCLKKKNNLAARDLDVTIDIPERSRETALGRTVEAGWERHNGVEVFPIPVSHCSLFFF